MWILRNVRSNTYAAVKEGVGWTWVVDRMEAVRWERREDAYKIAMRFYSHDAFSIERY